jgi:hypothetical protein
MGRYMTELGLSPVARARLDLGSAVGHDPVTHIELVAVSKDAEGNLVHRPLHDHAHQIIEH